MSDLILRIRSVSDQALYGMWLEGEAGACYMTPPELSEVRREMAMRLSRNWLDLRERLERAETSLKEQVIRSPGSVYESARLQGKSQGTNLAVSYMRDYRSLEQVARES